MKELLTHIVKSILDQGDKVVIDEKETDGVVEFTIHVPQEEIGKLIGKEGKVIRSIRTVVRILAIKEHKKIHINLVELA